MTALHYDTASTTARHRTLSARSALDALDDLDAPCGIDGCHARATRLERRVLANRYTLVLRYCGQHAEQLERLARQREAARR
jgi:hypothetical protein